LDRIKESIGVGNIHIRNRNNSISFSVRSIKDLTNSIIPHFDKYSLLTQKKADFLLFKLAAELINQKQHLTMEGLRKIVAIRASMNKGLTEELKTAFPDIEPVPRPKIDNLKIKDAQ
jgi:hypothetical protein